MLPADVRVIVWAIFVVGWATGAVALELTNSDDLAVTATESTIERFGLFTIIVLGEVVVGVVTGLSEVEHNLRTTATGLIGLMIGFGIWWTYFDFVGRRAPRSPRASVFWMISHLPVTLAIAASGATDHGPDREWKRDGPRRRGSGGAPREWRGDLCR